MSAQQVRFVQEFLAKATQLNSRPHAQAWFGIAQLLANKEITLTADAAARWASLGYTAAEALEHIIAGVTPELAGTMDGLATEIAGGSEQRAMQVIDGLVADGILIDPARVHWREDPNDPMHIIVDIDPES